MMTKTMTTTHAELAPLMIDLTVQGGMDRDTRATIDRLSYALEHQNGRCDAIGECGAKCSLRAGHPGDIHEEFAYFGEARRFRLTGAAWKK